MIDSVIEREDLPMRALEKWKIRKWHDIEVE